MAATGARSVAVTGDIRNSVIVTGDNVNLQVQLEGVDGALLHRLAVEVVANPVALPVPIDSRPRRYPEHVDRESEAGVVLAAAQEGGVDQRLRRAGDRQDAPALARRERPGGRRAAGRARPRRRAGRPARRRPAGALRGVLRLRRPGRAAFAQPPATRAAATGARSSSSTISGSSARRRRPSSRRRRAARSWSLRPRGASGTARRSSLRAWSSSSRSRSSSRRSARPLTPEERVEAEALCNALGGHPWRIREAAARARDEGRSLAEAARALDPTAMLASG